MRTQIGKRTRQRGAATVETALVVAAFSFMITGILDYATYLHARSRLQWAVSQTARYAVTGAREDNPGQGQGRGRENAKLKRSHSIRKILEERSGITLRNDQIDVFSVGTDGKVRNGAGGPGDVVVMRVMYETTPLTPGVNTLFANGKLPIRVTARFRNEEFTDDTGDPEGHERGRGDASGGGRWNPHPHGE